MTTLYLVLSVENLDIFFYPSFNSTFDFTRNDEHMARISKIRIETKKPMSRVGRNYVLLKIKDSLGDIFGYIPLAVPALVREIQTVIMLSYDDAEDASENLMVQDACEAYYDELVDVDKDYPIRHDCDASDDLFGGPLVVQKDDQYFVLGLHNGHDEAGGIHVATGYHTIAAEYGDILYDPDAKERPGENEDDDDVGLIVREASSPDDAESRKTLVFCIVIIALVWVTVIVIMKKRK